MKAAAVPAFVPITFTPAVRAAQAQARSREQFAGLDAAGEAGAVRAPRIEGPVADWLRRADSFFVATVSSSGWPYVQHRGGAPGMLRVVDERHFEFDDVAGNGQMITVGNLRDNDRVMLIFVDYEQRARLKLWGRATVSELTPDEPDYDRRVRRIRIRLEAASFNCSAFIPQMVRFE